jgi:hypothetical protein
VQEERWRELFESADAISEGAARDDGNGVIWYGSTSMILPLPNRTAQERSYLAAVAARDVHVRLRAVRTARREAAMRAPGVLGRSTCEIQIASDPRGVRIDVDIQAPLIESAEGASTSSRRRV